MELDFQTQRQLNRLKGEIKSIDKELESEKNSFADFLNSSLGESILKELETPKKRNFINGLIMRLKRWITIRNCKKNEKMIKQLIYENEQFDNDIKTNFYD